MDEIVYAYPIANVVSFTHVARHHVRYLREYVKIHEVDVDSLDVTYWGEGYKLFVHPICYPFFDERKGGIKLAERFLDVARRKRYKLVGFEVADSDELSEPAVELMSRFDLLVFPSTFARNVYVNSCELNDVTPTDSIVVPHGISEEFYEPPSITDPNLRAILELKKEKNLRFVLFQLAHSSYRKGADLFVKAMSIVQARRPNVVILLKTCEQLDPYVREVEKLRNVRVSRTLPLDVYVQLYDVADVVVLTSRGGAFECAGLEGIARGKPTIVPNAGCFLDYVEYTIPVEVTDARPTVLEGNPIHVGRGWEVDVHDLADKIVEVVDHYDEYREKFDEYAEEVRRKYSWKRIVRDFVVELSKRSLIEITTKPYESRITL